MLDPKTEFDSSGHERPEYISQFYLNVTDDVTCQIKRDFLLPLIGGFAKQNSRVKLKQGR